MKIPLLQQLVLAVCRRLSVNMNRMKYPVRSSRLLAGPALLILPFLASPVGAQNPILGITNDPASGVSVFWPVADAAYSLQWTPDLEPPVVWQPYSATPALSGDANSLVVNLALLQATNPRAFFLLVSNPVVLLAAPSVVTAQASDINPTVAFLNGTVQPNGLDTTCWFEYGPTTTPYANYAGLGVVAGTNTGPVLVQELIIELAPATTYHFQLYGSNSDGIASGGDLTFTTSAPLPDALVQTFAASNVTTTSAVLLGNVNNNGSAFVGEFEWGTTTNYGDDSNDNQFYDFPNQFQPVDESYVLTNLAPNTTYHYRIVGYNGGPDEALGNDVVFTTSSPVQQSPPTVTIQAASSVSSNCATFNGSVSPNGAPTTYYFIYGSGATFSQTATNSAGSGSSAVSVQATVCGLAPNTTYGYALYAANSGGSAASGSGSFMTVAAPQAAPTVIVSSAYPVGSTTATLNGTVNPNGAPTAYIYNYGTSQANLFSSTATFSDLTGNSAIGVPVPIHGLLPGTTYYYTLSAANSGGTTIGPIVTFTTSPAQSPPYVLTLLAGGITGSGAILNAFVNPNGADTFAQFQFGTNTNYGNATTWTNLGSFTNQLLFQSALGNLALDTAYHYRIVASNSAGTSYGADASFGTGLGNSTAGMVSIPAGSFTMGDTLDGEADAIPAVRVVVSPFYMDANLVSLTQWQTVYNWALIHGYLFFPGIGATAANNPVQTIEWEDAVNWCNARSQMAGLTPVYYSDPAFTAVRTNNSYGDTVYADWTANGYRLPTEAEWEIAARGGIYGLRFPWGDFIVDAAPPAGEANYTSTGDSALSGGYDYGSDVYPQTSAGPNPAAYYLDEPIPWTTPVGLFAPNSYGLNDMAGNLQEWCWDWYAGPPYPTGSPYLGGTNPRGPSSSTGYHVTRGGSWSDPAYNLRCANRGFYITGTANLYIGFRCVKGP
jgi:formylglycine-generating enzyme required for sulfatase activity